MDKEQKGIKDFMANAGQPTPHKPVKIDESSSRLRVELIREELEELKEALGFEYTDTHVVFHPEQQDLVKCADAIGDLIYVVKGAAVALGIDIEPIFEEIQRSNMTKFIDGYRREDGKWIKGPSYTPANLKPIVEKQLE